MNETNDFIDWLWGIEPDLASRVQTRYTHYLSMIPGIDTSTLEKGDSFIIEETYRITCAKRGLLLYHLRERDGALMAVYQSPDHLFMELITHRLSNRKFSSIQEFTAELTRLAKLCEKTWIDFIGGNYDPK